MSPVVPFPGQEVRIRRSLPKGKSEVLSGDAGAGDLSGGEVFYDRLKGQPGQPAPIKLKFESHVCQLSGFPNQQKSGGQTAQTTLPSGLLKSDFTSFIPRIFTKLFGSAKTGLWLDSSDDVGVSSGEFVTGERHDGIEELLDGNGQHEYCDLGRDEFCDLGRDEYLGQSREKKGDERLTQKSRFTFMADLSGPLAEVFESWEIGNVSHSFPEHQFNDELKMSFPTPDSDSSDSRPLYWNSVDIPNDIFSILQHRLGRLEISSRSTGLQTSAMVSSNNSEDSNIYDLMSSHQSHQYLLIISPKFPSIFPKSLPIRFHSRAATLDILAMSAGMMQSDTFLTVMVSTHLLMVDVLWLI